MHPQFFAILPATAILIAGYVTLYFAMASQGKMRTFGKILGGWTILLAILVIVAAIVGPALGMRPPGMMGMHGRMHGGMMDRDGPPGGPPAMAPGAAGPDGPPPPPPPAQN